MSNHQSNADNAASQFGVAADPARKLKKAADWHRDRPVLFPQRRDFPAGRPS